LHRFNEIPNVTFHTNRLLLEKSKSDIEYDATDNKIQWSVIEKFEFNNDGLIERSSVYYGKEES
jgi:hypothetical protein